MPDVNHPETSTDKPGFSIEISRDEMEAYIVLPSPPGNSAPNGAAVREALADRGVRYGIKDDIIAKFDTEPPSEPRLLVAEGFRPEIGKDGAIEFAVDHTNPVRVRKGEKIATVTPPEDNRDGINVFERDIPARKGSSAVIPKLENIDITDNGSELVSQVEGYLTVGSASIAVRPFFTLSVSADAIEAAVTVAERVSDGDFGPDDLKAFLADNGIVYGILDDTITRIFSERLYERPVTVARGNAVVDGTNGVIQYYFETEAKPTIDEKGNIDFKELNIIRNVKKDDRLAEILPPMPGADGHTVLGAVIKAQQGVKPVLTVGKNTSFDPSSTDILLAAIDGCVKLNGAKVEVEPLYVVQKHVDYTTGNINFVGAVEVHGDVMSGFRIKAKGDVQINGVVEDAVIESDGSVNVKMGFIGKGHGIIIAKGNVTVAFCENEHIVAEGDIMIGSFVMNGILETRGSIDVTNKNGLIVGGECYAVKSIKANTIGGDRGIPTKIHAGTDRVVRTYFTNVIRQIARIENLLLKHNRRKLIAKESPPSLLELIGKLEQVLADTEKLRDSLITEIETLDERAEEFRQGSVDISDTIHPGVTVMIYDGHKTFQDKHMGISIRYGEQDLTILVTGTTQSGGKGRGK